MSPKALYTPEALLLIFDRAAFLSSSLTPVFGLGAFILIVQANNTGTLTQDVAFAALTIFDLQTQPANYLLNIVEDFQIIINCFQRIQEYLLSEELRSCDTINSTGEALLSGKDSERSPAAPADHASEKQLETDNPTSEKQLKAENPTCKLSPHNVFEAENVFAGYTSGAKSTLKNLNFAIASGKTTVVIGPVGAGKSAFVKMLLGELPSLSGRTRSSLSQVAYCPQTAWITKGTFRTNIVGMSTWDQSWYNQVIRACALQQDIDELPDGDGSETGTRGSRLSGGQKARLVCI